MPEILFRAKRFQIERVQQELADGGSISREIVRHPGAVVILPLVSPTQVCLLRNFRVAVGCWLWELPAGTLEPNEPHRITAVRELAEETGYEAGAIEHIHSFRMSPGILDEQMHFYVAEQLTAGQTRREVGEEMENHLFSWDQLDHMIRDGQIEDAKTLVALLWYKRYRKYA